MTPKEPGKTDAPRGGDGPTMPLALASVGQKVTLSHARGGRTFLHRLAEMGLTPGAQFRVLHKGRPGPFIIRIKGSRFVLGQGMVCRIFVHPA